MSQFVHKIQTRSFLIYSDFQVVVTELNVTNMVCNKCKKFIDPMNLHKIVMFVVRDKFTEHYYEHVECPNEFSV